ncbi:MAG: hypothetical protein VX017_09780, partial [Pseudomonadota bacterium]|nr:hypothetical protein [Pseudomonadota bacterium]
GLHLGTGIEQVGDTGQPLSGGCGDSLGGGVCMPGEQNNPRFVKTRHLFGRHILGRQGQQDQTPMRDQGPDIIIGNGSDSILRVDSRLVK